MTAIVTKRLLLVPCLGNAADIKQMVEWLNDKELMQYSEQRHGHHDFTSQRKYIESFCEPDLFRLIVERGRMIGTITAHVDKHNLVADMGILIGDKSKHGQGYGTEAWVALMEHLFGTGILKIEAGCMQTNQGMIHIFKKSGMSQEGSRWNHFVVGNYPSAYTLHDMELWAKFNDGVH